MGANELPANLSSRSTRSASHRDEERISRASAGRLSLYLRYLEGRHAEGATRISSSELGQALGLTDAQVRRDLAHLGNLGQRGIGYGTEEVIRAIRGLLGLDRGWRVILVGVGNLARALLRYSGFRQRGFHFVGLYDNDPAKIGQRVDGLEIYNLDRLAETAPPLEPELALLTVPAESAQIVADVLTQVGIRGILNFAPVVLRLPESVSVVTVDFSIQMEQLAFRVSTHDPSHRLSNNYPVV